MKKKLLIAVLATTATLCGALGFAGCFGNETDTDNNSDKLNYYEISDGTYAVQAQDKLTITNAEIPSSYNGKPVTTIGQTAFNGCKNLKSVTIPDSITRIESGAFGGTALETVTIPDSVNELGESAFNSCLNLTSITLGKNITSIEGYTFYACMSLQSINIHDNITTIGDYAFYRCSNLENLIIGDGVTTIGNRAFTDCPLTDLTVGQNLTDIDRDAFGILSIENLTAPISVISIMVPYINISTLKNLNITGGETIKSTLFKNSTELTSITISDSVTSIGTDAFVNCTKIESATIPTLAIPYIPTKNLKTLVITSGDTISENAYLGCLKLENITIPESVTSISCWSFSNCPNLASINVANGNTKYFSSGNCLIEKESKTIIRGGKNSVIPDDGSVTCIGECSFNSCIDLTEIIIPVSVNSIGLSAFAGASNLTSIVYKGTKAQWNELNKADGWNDMTGEYTVHCTDGDIEK